METKNTRETKPDLSKAGIVSQARSAAGWLRQVIDWVGTAPSSLKPERIQDAITVAQDPALASWVGKLFDWVDSAPEFVQELLGFDNDDDDSNDKS